MTPQTGIAPFGPAVPGAVDGGLETQHPEERPPAAPEPVISRLGDEVLTWASCDTTADALRAVHDVAALRLASRSN